MVIMLLVLVLVEVEVLVELLLVLVAETDNHFLVLLDHLYHHKYLHQMFL
jgi:hypothetical protein